MYQTIELSFYDTQGIPIFCRDSDVTVTLVLSTEDGPNNHHQQRQMWKIYFLRKYYKNKRKQNIKTKQNKKNAIKKRHYFEIGEILLKRLRISSSFHGFTR